MHIRICGFDKTRWQLGIHERIGKNRDKATV